LGACCGRGFWACVLGVCFGHVFGAYILGVCFGRMFWAYVLGVCSGLKLWAYALSVCFKCMALERMALGASLWAPGFGRMSLGLWILPKKPEAKG